MEKRFVRQARLTEVGEVGQARLVASSVVVRGDGLAAETEARYLARAGVKVMRVSGATASAAPIGYAFADDSAREVAEGAMRALGHVVSILGGVEGTT